MDESSKSTLRIGAVVLAAGQSKRMGMPKMLLPWGSKLVIAQVVDTLVESGIDPIVVVTGGAGDEVAKTLMDRPVEIVRNLAYATNEMLDSLKIGLGSIPAHIDAILIVLGDQPTIQPQTIIGLRERYSERRQTLIIPSFQMRRGHPWLVDRSLWNDVLSLREQETLRDFLRAHQNEIEYLMVDTATILLDMDTPADYEQQKPD